MMHVPFNELLALYHGANLFVFPSLGEGFGIPPIEPVAYGWPSVMLKCASDVRIWPT